MPKKMKCFEESISRYSIVVMYDGAVELEDEEDDLGEAYLTAGVLMTNNPRAEVIIFDRFENRQVEDFVP